MPMFLTILEKPDMLFVDDTFSLGCSPIQQITSPGCFEVTDHEHQEATCHCKGDLCNDLMTGMGTPITLKKDPEMIDGLRILKFPLGFLQNHDSLKKYFGDDKAASPGNDQAEANRRTQCYEYSRGAEDAMMKTCDLGVGFCQSFRLG